MINAHHQTMKAQNFKTHDFTLKPRSKVICPLLSSIDEGENAG